MVKKIDKLFIANRGEIAHAILRKAQRAGIKVVVPIPPSDLKSLNFYLADEVVFLHTDSLQETFLNATLMVNLAKQNGCDALHPGYGFLSENSHFASSVISAGLIWIGPSPEVIALMGDKKNARLFAEKCGIPVLKGYYGNAESLQKKSDKYKYPLMIKAVYGGGGKGIKIARSPQELAFKLREAEREAQNYFGNSTLFVEHFIENARHIEVQIIADKYGNVLHLHERECSVQRRFQKLIEEAPAPNLLPEIKTQLIEDAVKLSKAAEYTNAGTVEFILENNREYYFLEMNTRIQVEHPVTEEVTGIDLISLQLDVAQGCKLNLIQDNIVTTGHAIEARLYSEDPFHNFIPSSGEVVKYFNPETQNIRIETHWGDYPEISSSFDPTIAKVISYGKSREEARKILIKQLKEIYTFGISNNGRFLNTILESENFLSGKFFTHLCDSEVEKFLLKDSLDESILIASFFVARYINTTENNDLTGIFRFFINRVLSVNESEYSITAFKVFNGFELYYNDKKILILNPFKEQDSLSFVLSDAEYRFKYYFVNPYTLYLGLNAQTFVVKGAKSKSDSGDLEHTVGSVKSPLPGKVIEVAVAEGQHIKKGDLLVVIESMKTENKIIAPGDGTVKSVCCTSGSQVRLKELLVILE